MPELAFAERPYLAACPQGLAEPDRIVIGLSWHRLLGTTGTARARLGAVVESQPEPDNAKDRGAALGLSAELGA